MKKKTTTNPLQNEQWIPKRVVSQRGLTTAIAKHFDTSIVVASYALNGRRNSNRDKLMRTVAVNKYGAIPLFF